MLKKSLATLLLSLAATATFADAPITIDVKGNMPNQPFQIDADKGQWGYQFNNATGKTLKFTAKSTQNSKVLSLQCWHGTDPVETYTVYPGTTSQTCVTNDTIRLVTYSPQDKTATGTYTITVG